MKSAAQKYKTNSVQTASKEKILLMLYEAAIRFTKLAIIAADDKKIAERGQNIGRAYDIVLELNNTLDHKIGGDVAKHLEQLYMFITDKYTQANITGEAQHLREAVKILETLYDGWVKAVEQLKKA